MHMLKVQTSKLLEIENGETLKQSFVCNDDLAGGKPSNKVLYVTIQDKLNTTSNHC